MKILRTFGTCGNDNDEVIEAYEDIKNFWNLRYRDWFKVGAQYRWNDDLNDDGTLDGEGVATHSDLALGDYTYEFKIPLNSDDIHDLSVSAGSTIGIKIMYREMYWDTTSGVWEWKGEDGWPTSGRRFDGSTYEKLVLSSAGTEAPSVITNDATNITTNSATLNGNLGDVGTASTVDVSFEWGPDTSYGNETTPETMTATGPFSFELTDLPPATTYHFRAKAIGEGTSYGLGKSFTTTFDPMNYDADGDGTISKAEALNAVVDYFDGAITKEQALEVIALYFAS